METFLFQAKFDPMSPPEEDSPEWNMAMIQLLLHLKGLGHDIREITINKVGLNEFGWSIILKYPLNNFLFSPSLRSTRNSRPSSRAESLWETLR